jgi:hypothetical protein
MTDTPEEVAVTRPNPLADIISSVKELIPAISLAVVAVLLVFFAVPPPNHDPLTIVVSGFLGFLTGRSSRPNPPPPAPPAGA